MPSSSPDPVTISIPRVGAVANVRNRRGLVTAVAPFGEPQVHLVTIEYLDSDGVPEDQLLWEVEANARLLEPTALPDPSRDAPMLPGELEALVRATRWTALSRLTSTRMAPAPSSGFPFRPLSGVPSRWRTSSSCPS